MQEIEEKELETIVKSAPWDLNPYSPLSLWEMLVYSGQLFHAIGHTLSALRCEALHDPGPGDPAFNNYLQVPMSREMREKALQAFELITKNCAVFGMPVSTDVALKAAREVSHNGNYNRISLVHDINAVLNVIRSELKAKLFFYISPEKQLYLPKANECIFGDKVYKAFPSIWHDAQEAGMCLALSRGTACVFHLMRALEVPLAVVGRPFDVSLEHTNWGPAIDEIEKKIGLMGKDKNWTSRADWKELQEFYSQAVSHLRVTKNGWRNYTAHLRGKFTEGEAQTMFLAVKAFMEKLSERLAE